jgi:hypothetical protein
MEAEDTTAVTDLRSEEIRRGLVESVGERTEQLCRRYLADE